MKAVAFFEHGGPEKLRWVDLPLPKPGPGEVRLQTKACALNHLDIWLRLGIPGLTVSLPHVVGADVAGVVEAVGSGVATDWVGQSVLVAPGISCGQCDTCRSGDDHLCAHYDILGQVSQGGYAEAVIVPAANLRPLPAGLSFEEGASLSLVFITAWQMLVTNGQIREGQTVLIHGAGSGVGVAAIQIARHFGARVITTVGDASKVPPALALGAEAVILHREQDFQKEVMSLTSQKGVDLVVDHIGQETFEKSLMSLARGGRLLTCGATSGRRIEFDLRALFGRNVSIVGSRMGRRDGLDRVLALVAAGRLKPVIDSVFPLAQAATAQERMASRRFFGKILLKI